MISRFKKDKYLRSLSEEQFRDGVVRPLFLRQGMKDGRDVCGPTEQGKDAIFISPTPLGTSDIYVVQTKAGNLTLARDPAKNVMESIAQLRTALDTTVVLLSLQQKMLPAKAILCASGKINDSARRHILEQIRDPRIMFLDGDDLVPKIDSLMPELWLGIDANAFPYFRRLRTALEESSELVAIPDVLPRKVGAAILDAHFVPIYLERFVQRPLKPKQKGTYITIPIESVVNVKSRRVIIAADAGSGKSTSLRRVAYILAGRGLNENEIKFIPVLLRARDIAESSEPVVNVAAMTTAALNDGKPVFGIEELTKGIVTLLVDALDEIAGGDSQRDNVIKRLNDFCADYPRCQVIITSRRYSFVFRTEGLSQYQQYSLSPIGWKQAKAIIDRIGKGRALPPEASQELLRRLEDMHQLELTPLLVTVFAATSDYQRRDIPANITELFKKFTELMLGRWDATKGLSQQYQAPLKDFLTRKIGYEMHRREAVHLTETEFRALLTTELEQLDREANVEELFDELVHRSGLFRIDGENIEFKHFLLQEFFAGRGLPSDKLADVAATEWWRRALVFYFGEHADDALTLSHIQTTLSTQTPREVFLGAVAVGLALQAAYLIPVKQKLDLLAWVIDKLAAGRAFYEEKLWTTETPVLKLMVFFLTTRDALALDVLERNFDVIAARLDSGNNAELQMFLLIVGLLESGAAAKAEQVMKSFKPSDTRLLLAFHYAAHALVNHRMVDTDSKAAAARILEYLTPRVEKYMKQIGVELDVVTTDLAIAAKGATAKTLPAASTEASAAASPDPSGLGDD